MSLLILVTACSGLPPTEAGSDAGGVGSGGGSAGTTGTGGNAGTGGGSQHGDVYGSITVPDGQSIDGVEIIACVPDATGTDCDPEKSISVTLSGSGTSGAFDLTGIAEPCYVLAVKDANQNQTVDAGDLVGGMLDENGEFALVTPPIGDLSISLKQIAAPTGQVPADLVGVWDYHGSYGGQSQTFNADGSWIMVALFEPTGSCIGIDKQELYKEGYANVQGNQLEVTPTSGEIKSYDCSGNITPKPISQAPVLYTWSLVVNEYTNALQLILTDPADPNSSVTLTKQ